MRPKATLITHVRRNKDVIRQILKPKQDRGKALHLTEASTDGLIEFRRKIDKAQRRKNPSISD
jgi:hypothetical protein